MDNRSRLQSAQITPPDTTRSRRSHGSVRQQVRQALPSHRRNFLCKRHPQRTGCETRRRRSSSTHGLVFVEQQGKVGFGWWLWVFNSEDTVVYVLDDSRSHQVPEDHYSPQAGGVLMVDRYSAYKAMLQVKNGTLILVFCWAHVRRDFVRVGKGWHELKSWALDWLQRIRDLRG